MKKLFLITAFLFTACEGHTQYGECIGINLDNADPNLIYHINGWNTFWSYVGIETIIAPVLWYTDYARCPVGVKKP